MYAFVEFSWSAFDKLSRDDWNKLCTDIPQLGLPEWKLEVDKVPNYYKSDALIDLQTDGPRLAELNVAFTVKKFKQTYISNPTEAVNNHLHVHIPNIGLLMIDEVTWLEDECTEELQRKLDDGWRILAVCPPNSQRRPDYILGRTKEK